MTEYYWQRKASGLCVRCACAGQDGGRVLCRRCREIQRAKRAEDKARRIAARDAQFDKVRHNMI